MKISRLFRRILMLLAVLFVFGINAFNVSPALAADYDLTQIYFLCDTNGTIADFSDGTAAMLNSMLADISDFDCSDIKTPIKCDGNTVTKWKHGNDTGILGGDLCDYIKGTMKAEYGYSLYAEEIATETCSADQMIIDGACVEPEFTITTTNMAAGKVFKFNISASGTYYIDWGDGSEIEIIEKTNTKNITYSHKYADGGVHTIGMSGDATGYTTSNYVAVISFTGNTNIKSVGGSLGAIFGDSAKYMFGYTFSGCTSLQSIPENLFAGVAGSADAMFNSTFSGCTSLQSIPENLFAGVTGSADAMFNGTFSDCTSLQSIPENLFAGITGSAGEMFNGTFSGCTSLQSIPENLFAGVTGSADAMFNGTFSGCTSLQSIPENLFAGVTGSAYDMFGYTFSGCTSLQSLPSGLFKNITGKPAFGAFAYAFNGCTNLTGYIPYDMFAGLEYASGAMIEIFNNTALDTICPAGTYQYITGFESDWSGKVSCAECPDGTTSAAGASDISQCVGGRTLHIGDDITMNLTTIRPETPRVMVFQVLDELYYGGLSDTEKTINKNTDKKFRIFFDNKDYWLHDYTVE